MNFHTDSVGIVHHARYLELLEEARWQYCYTNNLMNAYEKRGLYHVIVNINIDYKDSAKTGDVVCITTEVETTTTKSVVFKQCVWRGDTLLISAAITNVYLSLKNQSVITTSDMASFWDDLKS